MRKITSLVVLLVLSSHGLALASDAPDPQPAGQTFLSTSAVAQRPSLRDAISREATRLATELPQSEARATQAPATQNRGWIGRHPVLFGAIVGAGVGAVTAIPQWNELYCAGGGDEDCFFHGGAGVLFGAGLGAGIGALTGLLIAH